VPKSLSQTEIDDFRTRLISVAERLFAEEGRDAVSMRQLAHALGVSVMTPYRYFKDKDEILAATRASGFDRFAEALETAYDSVNDPVERARMVGDAYLKFAFENPSAYRLMFDLTQPNEEGYPELARAGERARKTMSAYVECLINAGQLVGEPDVIAHVCWAAIHGLVVLKLADKIAPHIAFDLLWQELRRALNVGFGPQNRLTAAA
jgi:AcrR family transcriptional regulator